MSKSVTAASKLVNNINADIWKEVESALVNAIRADPKGLQAIKPRLLNLLHSPASDVINNNNNNKDNHVIKSLYKATGLESDSDSDSESELPQANIEEDLCYNKEQQTEEEDTDMLADFLEGELLRHEAATSCNITATSSKVVINNTSNFTNSDVLDYHQKLELSRQKLKAGYATQQQAKEKHRIKVISSSNAAKHLLLSPKRTITKRITHYSAHGIYSSSIH